MSSMPGAFAGRPSTWLIPEDDHILDVIYNGGEEMIECMNSAIRSSSVLRNVLQYLNCPTGDTQCRWLLRRWRDRLCDKIPHSSSPSESLVEPSCNFQIKRISSLQWEKMKPVLKNGRLKMFDWVSTFVHVLEGYERCTLIGKYHNVSRKYNPSCQHLLNGIISGRLACSNDCPVVVNFTSLKIEPGIGAEFKFTISGQPNHLACKPRQLRGIQRVKEAHNLQSAAERRFQLITEAGMQSSNVFTSAVFAKIKIRVECH